MIDKKAWDIISPYDISDPGISFEVRLKAKRSKSALEAKRKKKNSPEQARKSLPRQIDENSHVLTPTKCFLLKSQKKKKSLSKSKSSTNLTGKEKVKRKRSDSKEVLEKYYAEKLPEFNNCYIGTDDETGYVIGKKTSNPKNLEIDTENIENDYISPVNYDPLPIEIMKIDSLNFYSSAFTMKEAISSDLLTGKIYPSEKQISSYMLEPLKALGKTPKFSRTRKKSFFQQDSLEIEVVCPDESAKYQCEWKNLARILVKLVKTHKKTLIQLLIPYQKAISHLKIDKSQFIRPCRSLKDLSLKIGKIIENVLLKSENNIQQLIENNGEILKLQLNYPSQYCQSSEMYVDLFFCLWDYKLKPLSPLSLSVYLESDRMISEIPKLKDPSLRLQHILNFIPLLLVTWRHIEAKQYIETCLKTVPLSKPVLLWQAWLEILSKKSTSAVFYALSESNAPPNLSFQYKIALVYSYFFSCMFSGISRTIGFVKTLHLDHWESIVIADIYTRSTEKAHEDLGIEIFSQLTESSNMYIRFLAIFRLFHIYKQYNQHGKALEILKKPQNNIPDHLKTMLDTCKLKISAYLSLKIEILSEIPLLKYQFARLSLKYNLQTSLHKVIYCINQVCAYSQLYSITSCQFPANFWKFILLRKLGVHKLAAKQAILTLDYESTDKVKLVAINEYVKSIENAVTSMQDIYNALIRKEIHLLNRLYGPIFQFDELIGSCMKAIYTKDIEDKGKIPPHKFEGYFAVWSYLYNAAKHKEKQFKPLEGQEEIDKRDNQHPLYVLTVAFM